MAKRVRVSLANKCQLLFGAAVILILLAALLVVALRMSSLVERQPRKRAQDFANAWLEDRIQLGGAIIPVDQNVEPLPPDERLTLSLIEREDFERLSARDAFIGEAIDKFERSEHVQSEFTSARDAEGDTYYRYARAIRESDLDRLRSGLGGVGPLSGSLGATLDTARLGDPLEMLLLIQLRDEQAQREKLLNRIYLAAAGLAAGLLAIAAFWFITTRIILSPVRVLHDYAERVSEGDTSIRSDINTGDEFEALSNMFNTMLDSLKDQQDRLHMANKTLDLRVGELAESNVALYEANKMKGEFLANVSHELRTPLNSIIGFAEVLDETLPDPDPEAEAQAGRGGEGSGGKTRAGEGQSRGRYGKQRRYARNIITSARRLLDLINDLLDLAKIEAGKMEPRVEPVSLADVCEGLATLMRPQAEARDITIRLKVEPRLPLVHTDAGKLQQILFNFLANAVKFTPDGGTVELTASAEYGREADPGAPPTRVRVGVTDTGPGIAEEDQERIFEKFTQLDPSVTKRHGGTGLGLTISRELADMLHATIDVRSAVDRGATFSLILPVKFPQARTPLMPEGSASSA
ncbi:MAG: ATP-binding protein [Phycisphaeraceae bacterium]